MLRKVSISMIALMLICGWGSGAHADNQAAVEPATKAAEAWLKLVDSGNYQESWNQLARIVKPMISAQAWAQKVASARQPLGAVVSRKLKKASFATSLPGAPDGQYVVIQYDTAFENKKSAVETITPMLDTDGKWRVSGYYIKQRAQIRSPALSSGELRVRDEGTRA